MYNGLQVKSIAAEFRITHQVTSTYRLNLSSPSHQHLHLPRSISAIYNSIIIELINN